MASSQKRSQENALHRNVVYHDFISRNSRGGEKCETKTPSPEKGAIFQRRVSSLRNEFTGGKCLKKILWIFSDHLWKRNGLVLYRLFSFGHLSLIRNNTQTAVTNIRYKLILFEIIFYLTFRMLLHTSSEVTVNTKLEFKYTGLLTN